MICPSIYILIGYDPIKPEFLLVGVDKSKESLQKKQKERIKELDICYSEIFIIQKLKETFPVWLQAIGIPSSDITNYVRELGKVLCEVLV